jgi:hypothetical protein
MGWPYRFVSNFESGDMTEWDQQEGADISGILDVAHFTQLWQDQPTMSGAAPWKGAYALRAKTAAATTDPGYVEDQTLGVMSVGDNAFIRFRCFVGTDVANSGSAADQGIFELDSAGAVEVSFGIKVAADDTVTFGVGKLTPATAVGGNITKGQWYTCELDVNIASGSAGDITAYVTPEGANTVKDTSVTISSSNNAAVTKTRIGMTQNVANVSGTILIDDFIMDVNADPPAGGTTARLHTGPDRWQNPILLNKSGFAFVGPGKICGVSLIGDALSEGTPSSDDFLRIYDTDFMRTDGTDGGFLVDESSAKLILRCTAAGEVVESINSPFNISKGCFVHLGAETTNDTSPRGMINVQHATSYGSPGAVRGLAARIGAKTIYAGATGDV